MEKLSRQIFGVSFKGGEGSKGRRIGWREEKEGRGKGGGKWEG